MRADHAPGQLEPAAAQALAEATVGDPFALLGPHPGPAGTLLRVFAPGADAVEAIAADGRPVATLQPTQVAGLFAVQHSDPALQAGPAGYRLRIRWPGGSVQETEDPYAFGLLLGEVDLYLIGEGRHFELGRCLGAQAMTVAGIPGVRFAVWAPNARRVSVVGGFNSWDGRRHPMRKRVEAGVWELFIPRLLPGEHYKYEILGPHGLLPHKADPVAQQAEAPPRTASVVADPTPHAWQDHDWMAARAAHQAHSTALSIYELHAGSWRRRWDGHHVGWDELADQLIPYVTELGFTHIELMPIMAHPFDGSWGYQPLGLYAPQASYGEPGACARFIDRCHQAGIGVLLDWVPAHFPTDAHGLAHFDGTPLYEHADPREGFHQDWNTLIYNLGRHEVQGFLIASALHWLEHYHIDGLRVDAVASMLYRDYSRGEGEWIPNHYGGRENLEAIQFLRTLNDTIAERCPGALVIAEESTAWPGVTQAVEHGGLGFSYKWNMGWMHDSLRYMANDPVHRAYEHHQLTFGLLYAFSERFVLPLSHDEVVHGKGSLLARMPGDRWQRFANLRAYFGFMWGHPGKKLLFMGGELAQEREWNQAAELDWAALVDPLHRGVQRLIGDLNRLLRTSPALYGADSEPTGFAWVVGDDHANSAFAFCRFAGAAAPVLVVCNFTPVPRHGYRVGVPCAGHWRECLNSDAAVYGGGNIGNGGGVDSGETPSHGQPYSVVLTLPPLATVFFVWEG